MTLSEKDKKYVANTYARFDLEIEHGEGALLYDYNGKEYIDLGAGIAVNTFGANDSIWLDAVINQAKKIQHTSNLYYSSPQAELAQMLCEKTGMKKVFFSNSGAEANECAIKTARKYSFDKYGEGRSTIITLKNSFHGRTVTTLSATGQDVFHTKFGPFTEGFIYVEANNVEELKKAVENNSVCGIMLEPIQGEGGVMPITGEFFSAVANICEEKDILMIVDEVQTGNGRTGKLYGYMNFGVKPDIVSTAKGLAGGLPLGATMMGEKVENTLTAGTHGSTFGGNPICAAAAVSVLSRLDDKLLEEVNRKSLLVFEMLDGAKGIESVAGMGLMLGIKTEKPAGEIVKKCMELGVVALTAKDKVRLLPPLCITDEQLIKAVDIIKTVAAR